jgi:hypothetical protein
MERWCFRYRTARRISDTEPPAAFPIPCPDHGSETRLVHRVPNLMPQRGIAYQPRVQTLGITRRVPDPMP